MVYIDLEVLDWFKKHIKRTGINSHRLNRLDAFNSFTEYCLKNKLPNFHTKSSFCKQVKVLMDKAGIVSMRLEKSYYVGVRLQ